MGNVGEQAENIKKAHEDIGVNVKILHDLGKSKRVICSVTKIVPTQVVIGQLNTCQVHNGTNL